MKVTRAFTSICGVGALAAAAALASFATPASASAGLHLVSASSPIDSVNAKSVTVSCPAGQYVMGTSAQVNIAKSGRAALVSITPLPGLTAVTAVAAETGMGTNANWNVKVYATCVNPVLGLDLRSATSTIDSQNKIAKATCAPGWHVVGTGAQVSTPDAGKAVLNAIRPSADITSVSVTGAEIGVGTPKNWSIKAYAICASPGSLAKLQILSNNTVANPVHAKSATVFCAPGTRVVGTAGSLYTPDSAHLILDEITPLPNLSGVTTVASEAAGGMSEDWVASTQAICASL